MKFVYRIHILQSQWVEFKVENILKGNLDLIPSPSPSMKIQIMDGIHLVCVRVRTRVGAAIFVHLGAEGALKMCVQVRAYSTFLVRTRANVRGRALHVRMSIKSLK